MNAYADKDFADAYHEQRQSAERWNDFGDEEKQRRLVSAADLIDRLFDDYAGIAAGKIRAFPRLGADGVPYEVLAANCELALLDDISGSLPDAEKLRNIGGVMLKTGKCGAEDKARYSALTAALPLLQKLRGGKSCRLQRG